MTASSRRLDGGRARRSLRRTIELAVGVWQAPRQRTLVLALAAAALSALAFARIAEDYLTNDPLARWDLSFARWLAGERGANGTDFFHAISLVGSPGTSLAVGAAVAFVLYRRRELARAAFLPLVLGGAELSNLILKLAFHRTRPEVASVHLDTYSFPSGHAMISTAAYGALAYLAWRRLETRRARVLLWVAVLTLVVLVGFSRLYLGVHYLSDVLAGTAGGACWLALSIAWLALWGERFAARLDGSRVDRLARRLARPRP